MTATYGPRVNVHPDRQGSARDLDLKWIVLHTSEQSGAEDPDDAEDLANYLTSPGDRPSSARPGQFYGSSYHAITDTARILPCVVDDVVAYAAGGGNRYGLHICLPVRAGQTRTEWLDAGSRPYIRQAAEYIVDKSPVYGLPIRHISGAQVATGSTGYCDHWAISQAFGKSTHNDVGSAFPWDVLALDIDELVNPPAPIPPEDPTMEPRYIRFAGRPAVWVTYGTVPVAYHVTAAQYEALGSPTPDIVDLADAGRYGFVETITHGIAP